MRLTPVRQSASVADRTRKQPMMRRLTAFTAIAVLGLLAADATAHSAPARGASVAPAATAPTDIGAQRRRRAPMRVMIVPLSRYYRQCVDWFALEHRPSGGVMTPQTRYCCVAW